MRITSTLIIAVILVFCGVVSAQDTGDIGNLAPLQKKAEALSADDQKVLDDWIGAHLTELGTVLGTPVSKDYSQGRKRAATLREIRLLLDAANGTQQYRSAYVQALAKRVEADRDTHNDVQLAVTSLSILVRLAGPSQAETMVKMLQAKAAAVQYWAVKGLVTVRDKLSSVQQDSIRSALVTFVKTCQDGPVASEVYSFFDQPQDSRARSSLVSLLEWRRSQYESKTFSALEGDAELFDVLTRAYGQADDAQKGKILTAMGMMLKYSVEFRLGAATTLSQRHRERLDLAIYVLESALGKIAKRSKTQPVLKAFKDGDAKAVQAGLVAWLGDADKEGILNASPFNLPRVLAPAKKPAPEKASTEQPKPE